MTEKEIEQGLTDKDWNVRWRFAHHTNYTPTPAQVERGLTDEDWMVRRMFARRNDFTLTPAQIERGLGDENWQVRGIFKTRHAEWTANWEASELLKRHAQVAAIKPKAEAL